MLVLFQKLEHNVWCYEQVCLAECLIEALKKKKKKCEAREF